MLECMEYLNLEIRHCFVAFSKLMSKGTPMISIGEGCVSYFTSDNDVHIVGGAKPC